METAQPWQRRLGRWWPWLSVGLIPVIGALDLLTGWELSFSIFYLAPVALAAWYGGRRAGVLASVCAALVWLAVDFRASQYATHGIVYWNAAVRLGFYVIIALLLSALRAAKDSLEEVVRRRTQELEKALDDLRTETRQRLEAEQDRLRAESEVLQASERELRRMGQDLHDTIQGDLVGLQMMLDALRTEELFPAGLGGQVDRLSGVVADTIRQTRALAATCCPVRLAGEGLPRALRKLAETTTSLFRKPCAFRGDGVVTVTDESTAFHLYYIAREAVANALKHAQAKNVAIALAHDDRGVVLSVEDDGVGLPAGAPPAAGMGMRTMSYRAAIVGGRLDVGPRDGRGTVVRCTIPPNPPPPQTATTYR